MKTGVLSVVKRWWVPAGVQARRIPFGLYRGLVLELDLKDRTQLFLGLWERETYPWLRMAAQSCDWMIDVGAGRGELCLFFVKHSKARRVVAVEPGASERELMLRNLALNGCEVTDALVFVNQAIGGGGPGVLKLSDLPVDATRSGFIKIDVDGGEMDVLQSGAALLKTAAAVDILLETHSLQLEEQCRNYLTRLGFECSVIRNAWWRMIVPEHRPIGHNRWVWATNRKTQRVECPS